MNKIGPTTLHPSSCPYCCMKIQTSEQPSIEGGKNDGLSWIERRSSIEHIDLVFMDFDTNINGSTSILSIISNICIYIYIYHIRFQVFLQDFPCLSGKLS